MSAGPIRIGTRASKLALTQSGIMQRAIAAALGVPEGSSQEEIDAVAPLVRITTSGDRIQDRRLMEVGGKGLFTKEIEEALLDGRIDCAVHSLKDMPALLPPGLCIAAIPEREDVRDAFLSLNLSSFDALPQKARLGTASLRRQAQALYRRPDLDVVVLRGNVDTRIAKLEAGEADAILLAAAGLNRLGLGHLPKMLLDPVEAPPAPGQGALAIETREGDCDAPWVLALRHAPTMLAIEAERAAMSAMEGSCRTAIGAYARIEGEMLKIVVEILAPDGTARCRREGETSATAPDGMAEAGQLGLTLGYAAMTQASMTFMATD